MTKKKLKSQVESYNKKMTGEWLSHANENTLKVFGMLAMDSDGKEYIFSIQNFSTKQMAESLRSMANFLDEDVN